jgi:microcompartment protein CcmK/EutM
MFLARVVKRVVSSEKHEAYTARIVYTVHRVDPDGRETGEQWVAMDCVGANIGDTVVCGGAPGAARDVFGLTKAPIRTLIMAVVGSLDYRDLA